jgi:hypothetical protein
MRFLMTVVLGVLAMFAINAKAGVTGYNGSTKLGVYSAVKCGGDLKCAADVGKLKISKVGGLENQVDATAVSITAAQCGSTFKNSGAVTMGLPEASTVLGCDLTFTTLNAASFVVNPNDNDKILIQTNSDGDSIINLTLGNSITLEAVSASYWAPKSIIGTWSDNN